MERAIQTVILVATRRLVSPRKHRSHRGIGVLRASPCTP